MSIECYEDKCVHHASHNINNAENCEGPYCHEEVCRVKATKRVAQFMVMVLAHLECSEQIHTPMTEEEGRHVICHFMGSGASDMLTVKDVDDFIKEQST